MQSLRGILSRHSSVLLIDSASTVIQVGLLQANKDPIWAEAREEAGVGVFAATETVLNRAAVDLNSIGAFVFCEGPGSVLGIRTAAVAVRTWNVIRPRTVLAFSSLSLVATFQLQSRANSFSVIADARRDSWHCVSASSAREVGPLRRLTPSELTGSLLMPEPFRHWAPLPSGVELVAYDVAAMLKLLPDAELFRDAPEPDAFLHEQPAYQTWTPQVHRAPTS